MGCTDIDNVSPRIDGKGPEGIISGKVTSANGSTAIGAAHVFAFDDSNSSIFSTYTDSEGNFILSAPAGNRYIYIQTGSGANFRTDLPVNIVANQTSTIPLEATRLRQVARLGYIEGAFDNVDEILSQMGYNLTKITDVQTLNNFDIVYLEVGSNPKTFGPQLFPALSAFVANGGNIYSSNWAASYLVGGELYPTDCNMPGGFVPDDKLCVKWRYNTTAPTPYSQILNERLKKAVGFSDFNLVLSKGSDSYISSYDPLYWETMIKDGESTHLIKSKKFTDPSAVSVNIGNAANDGWKTICVKDGASNRHTVRVPQSLATTLLTNGAQPGSCDGNTKSGTIYYNLFNADRLNPSGNSEKNMKIIKNCILDF